MKALKWSTSLVIVAVLLFSLGVISHAAENQTKVVRVGFPIQQGITYIDENGEYAGYLVDYLNQLTLFTNWKIEYVQAAGDVNTQLSTLLDKLKNGEIDMMGTMNRNAVLEEMFLYPSYSYGSTYTVLAVRDDATYIEGNVSNWNGITVAYYPGMAERMELFDQYAKVNGFTYKRVEYETHKEIVNAVLNGEVDAVLQVDIALPDGLRSIGRFSPKPYYFALSNSREDLLPELNAALEIVSTSYENLQHELYERYFLDSNYFRASQEEEEYIESLGTIQVLFFTGNAPFQYMRDGQLTGFAVEYFENFAKSTGLKYEIIINDNLEEARQLVKNNQVDLIACMAPDSALFYENRIRLSLPYFHSFAVRTHSKKHKHVTDPTQTFNMNTENGLATLLSNIDACLWMDGYSLNYYLRKEVVYDDIEIDWADIKDFSYAVAVTNSLPNADMMVSLLNQFAHSISDQDRQAYLSVYLSDKIEYTMEEWLLVNQEAIFVISICIILILGICAFYAYHKKMAYKTLASENKLLHLSIYDELTGAYNRTYFCKLVEQRIGQRSSGALIALNIHNFKYVNDTYGTQRADQLLCRIADILSGNLKDGELLCRPSADCFYLYVFDYLPKDVNSRVEGLQAQLKVMAEDLLDGYQISIYWGAVSSATSPDISNTQTNLNCLMVALAHAKKAGGSTVCMYDDSMHQEEQLRQYIETNMYRALDEEEYQVYLQPKKNLRTGEIDSAEALVRWQTKERGLIFPNQFIPLFEQNGFCKELDLYMLEKSCQILRNWMDDGIAPITISINQTESLFVSDEYVEKLLEITSRYQISPQYIVLEILEGLAFENIEEFNNTIARLNDAGFQVSMDDFGSGYSSLNTLGKLNIDNIKLDRMFLMDLREDHRRSQYEVMSLIFAMAKRLDIETVTEGVETKEDEDLIVSMGCDYGQGYYYSKPIPVDEFCYTFLKRG